VRGWWWSCTARATPPSRARGRGRLPAARSAPSTVIRIASNAASVTGRAGPSAPADPELGRPIAAPLDQCAELLGVDLAVVRELAAKTEPYIRADGTRIWGLMQLERQLRPHAYGRRRGGYLDRRQNPAVEA
jgi:hypothetical protein